jgi:hypothetical protein
MTASDTAATPSGPDHQEGRERAVTSTAGGAFFHSGQCRKCWRDITRQPGGHWTHEHNTAERCAPGTRNASLAEPIARSVRLHRR